MSVTDDLDLEPPDKIRPLLVEITTTYLVWVEDDDDLGAVDLAARENRDGDYELHKSGEAIDGGYTVRTPDNLDRWVVQEAMSEHGPWRVCPYPGCGRVEYPGYGGDPTCWTHRVIGCQDSRLPERTFA